MASFAGADRTPMLLAIDVGNTNIVIGVFRVADWELIHSWRLMTLRERTSDELGILVTSLCERHKVTSDRVTGIVMASVVPPLTGTTIAMVRDYFGRWPLNVEPAVNGGMPILYDHPDRRRRRPRRQRHRRLRGVRSPRRPAGDRRRFRHGDDLRRDLGEGRIPRWRDLPWTTDLRGRALPACGEAAADRSTQA